MPAAERFQGANVIDAGRLSPYWGEHAARYIFAREYISGRSVLDIACGTGFGIGLMKDYARNVAGVDVDIEAARTAAMECGRNASVLLGDGLSLPFADESFDVVTSFETLEHLHDRHGFLVELRRVLKQGGLLILSTPNANYTEPVDGRPKNRFHVHEYTPDELRPELDSVFAIETFVGQALRDDFGIPPFYDAQLRLARDLKTRLRLFGWKVLNKLPPGVRDAVSMRIWKAPFYPVSEDYCFHEELVDDAPVLVAVCRRPS
jgi:ubiquinone/menaquinone biosynthesis C-methylase UbiE